MSERERRFRYQRRNFFGVLQLIWFLAFTSVFLCNIGTFILAPENSGSETTGEILTSSAAILVMMLVLLSAYATILPEVEVRGSSFRVRKRFFRSRWMGWEQIRCVNEPFPGAYDDKEYRHQVVALDRFPLLLFLMVPFSGCFRGGFLVHTGSDELVDSDGVSFLAVLRERRPDLF